MTSGRAHERLRLSGDILAAVWVFGGAAFYFARFTRVFYLANRPAIDHLLERLAGG